MFSWMYLSKSSAVHLFTIMFWKQSDKVILHNTVFKVQFEYGCSRNRKKHPVDLYLRKITSFHHKLYIYLLMRESNARLAFSNGLIVFFKLKLRRNHNLNTEKYGIKSWIQHFVNIALNTSTSDNNLGIALFCSSVFIT